MPIEKDDPVVGAMLAFIYFGAWFLIALLSALVIVIILSGLSGAAPAPFPRSHPSLKKSNVSEFTARITNKAFTLDGPPGEIQLQLVHGGVFVPDYAGGWCTSWKVKSVSETKAIVEVKCWLNTDPNQFNLYQFDLSKETLIGSAFCLDGVDRGVSFSVKEFKEGE